MNVTDYWLMAREYSVWNAAVATLQVWTADLEAHILSSAIEQVYNAFFYTISTHVLCQQSEVLFGCFVTTLNAAFESKLALEDTGYESGSENFNILTASDILPESTMYPVMITSPLTPPLDAAWVPASHATNLYNASYPSVALMMKIFLQLTFHCLPAQYCCRTWWIFQSNHIPSAP